MISRIYGGKNGELIYFVFFCEKIRRNKNIYTCMLAFVKINNESKSQKSIKMVTYKKRGGGEWVEGTEM